MSGLADAKRIVDCAIVISRRQGTEALHPSYVAPSP
jgi:hypothetical protein